MFKQEIERRALWFILERRCWGDLADSDPTVGVVPFDRHDLISRNASWLSEYLDPRESGRGACLV